MRSGIPLSAPRRSARYIQLSGRSSLAPILKMEGVEVPPVAQPRESLITTRTCPRCNSENEGDALYCMRCGLALDDRALHVEREAFRHAQQLLKEATQALRLRKP